MNISNAVYKINSRGIRLDNLKVDFKPYLMETRSLT